MYKRQQSDPAVYHALHQQFINRCVHSVHLGCVVRIGLQTVSYTHLDVYKRQPMVTLRTGRPCSNVIMGLSRPTGEQRWISINTQAILRAGDARPYAVVGSFHDITERRRAEQALLEVQSQLEQRVRERTARIQQLESQRSQAEKLAALGHLAADIAHEVNNPLAGITNAFHLVKQGIGSEHRHYRFVDLIDREIQRLTAVSYTHLVYR